MESKERSESGGIRFHRYTMKKNTGSIAIPFLITLLVSFVILGGIIFFLFGGFGGGGDSLKQLEPEITLISEEDQFNLFCVLDTEESDKPVCYMFFRFNPVAKRNTCIALPANLAVNNNGASTKLDNVYHMSGVTAARDAAAAALNMTLDRYMVFDSTSFQKLCSILGGVECIVDEKIVGLQESDKMQYLGGSQIQLYLTYPDFTGGEAQRMVVVDSTIAEMLNQTDGSRISETLDRSFSTIINLVKDSDVTAQDYKNRKHAMKYMLEYAPGSTGYYYLSLQQTGDLLTIPENTLKNMQEMVK